RRRKPALIGLVKNEKGDQDQAYAVYECCQNLQPVIAERLVGSRRPRAEPNGHQRQPERGHVSQHVPGISQQSQGTGPPSAQRFGKHIERSEHQHNRQTTPAFAGPPMTMPMTMNGAMPVLLMATQRNRIRWAVIHQSALSGMLAKNLPPRRSVNFGRA